MAGWLAIAVIAPLSFVIYQTLSKLLLKDSPVFLVNAYVSVIGLLFMLALHLFLSENKSFILPAKTLYLAAGIGIFISLGNFGIIKAYSQGAPQSLFTPIFYVSLITYGILVGLLLWHEKINLLQGLGVGMAVAGLLMTVYFKK